jgi:TolA-binding protein
LAEEYLSKYGVNNGPAIIGDNDSNKSERRSVPGPKADTSDEEKIYYDALSIAGQGNFKEAQEKFQALFDSSANQDIQHKSSLEIGRCLYGQKQFEACVKYFGNVIKTVPDHPDVGDIMFIVGQAYEHLHDKAKAASVYERILQMGEKAGDDVRKKVRAAQKGLGGS